MQGQVRPERRKESIMVLCRNQSFRTLVAVVFSIGVLGFADGIPATWAAVPLVTLLSAALLPELLKASSPVPAGAQRRVQAVTPLTRSATSR
jgi:hypothetical protein